MTAMTDYLEGEIIKHIFRTGTFSKPATLYVGLATAMAAGESGSITEVTGGNYARVAVSPSDSNWNAISGNDGQTENTNIITFNSASADWGTCTHFLIAISSTGTTDMLFWASLTNSRVISSGATPSFAAGALTVQIDN